MDDNSLLSINKVASKQDILPQRILLYILFITQQFDRHRKGSANTL